MKTGWERRKTLLKFNIFFKNIFNLRMNVFDFLLTNDAVSLA